MADFIKYNGYNVKDASALAHASISGKTLTTTDRKGRVVDTVQLPGGDFPSATYMSYLSNDFVLGFQRARRSISDSNSLPIGLMLGQNVIGYAGTTWVSNKFQIDFINFCSVKSWQTFSKDGNVEFNEELGYTNNYLRQIRPNVYKAVINVGAFDGNSNPRTITVNADTATTVAQVKNNLFVSDHVGRIGYAIVTGVRSSLDNSFNETGLIYSVNFNSNGNYTNIVAYNPSSTNRLVTSVLVEVEIMLYDNAVEKFLANPVTTTAFIESANGYEIGVDSNTGENYAKTKIVIKNNTNENYLLEEWKLAYDPAYASYGGAWSYNQTHTETVAPQGVSPHNITYEYTHTIASTDEMPSAVYYVLMNSLGVVVAISDAIPIPRFSSL